MINRIKDKRQGAFSDSMIKDLIGSGFITGSEEKNINPGSLDLSISGEIYHLEAIIQPLPKETIRSLVDKIKPEKHDYKNPLLKDEVYLARLNESVELPTGVYGYCNPKSTTGRNDTHVRVISDGVSRYDTLPTSKQKSELWILINPKSYSILISPGQTLSQLRLFNFDTRFNESDLEVSFRKHSLISARDGQSVAYEQLAIKDGDGSIILSLDMDSEIIGYECLIDIKEVVDFSKVGIVESKNVFKTVDHQSVIDKWGCKWLSLKQGRFYLLSTAEAVRVPENLACEMVPMDERSGEFRSHYAGFIDPGWGIGSDGKTQGRPLTLEVRPFEDLLIRKGQPIAKIKFEKMAEEPLVHYDALHSSNYTDQSGVGLPKQFKQN